MEYSYPRSSRHTRRIYDDISFSDNPVRDELLKIVPESLIPEREEDQVRYLESLKRIKDIKPEEINEEEEEETPLIVDEDDEIDNDKVQSKLLELSNFHLGIEDDDVPGSSVSGDGKTKHSGSSLYGESSKSYKLPFSRGGGVSPINAGFDDITIDTGKQLEKYKKSRYIPENLPLRKDGTKRKFRDEFYYGREWVEEFNAAQEAIQSDPDYQFLFELAGATNTTVERLYDVDDIEVREMRARIIAQQETRKVQQKFQTFQSNQKKILDIEKEIATEKQKMERIDRFAEDFVVIYNILGNIDRYIKEFSEKSFKSYYLLVVYDMLRNVSTTFNYTKVTENLDIEEKEDFFDNLKYALGRIGSPYVKYSDFIDFMDPEKKSEHAGVQEIPPGKEEDYFPLFPEKFRQKTIYKKVENIYKDLPTYEPVRTQALEYIYLFIAIWLEYKGIGTNARQVAGALGTENKDSISNTFLDIFSNGEDIKSMVSTVGEMKNLMSSFVEEKKQKAKDILYKFKNELEEAYTLLFTKPDLTGRLTGTKRVRIDPVKDLANVASLSVDNPNQVFRVYNGDAVNQLRIITKYIGDVGDVTEIRNNIQALEQQKALIEKEQNTIMTEGIEEPEIPYRPEPSWVLRPEFTGKIRMQPIVRYAINQAYSDTIRKFLPELSTARGNSETDKSARTKELEKLMHHPDYRPHFIQIVAAWMSRSRTMFQVRWMPDMGKETLRMMDNALSGLSYVTGIPRNRNVRRPGRRDTLTMPSVSDIYTASTGVPRYSQRVRFM